MAKQRHVDVLLTVGGAVERPEGIDRSISRLRSSCLPLGVVVHVVYVVTVAQVVAEKSGFCDLNHPEMTERTRLLCASCVMLR